MDEKRRIIEQYLELLLKERFAASDHKSARLSESVAYSLLQKGKRVRPIITLLITESYRPIDEQAVALACTTELLHTASLMLDDLPSMDDARTRRGKPANHLVYGESTTILAAMALWSEAVRLMSTIDGMEINDIVRETAESVGQKGLVRGQFLDLNQTVGGIADVEECAYFKTAILFKNAARIGALLGMATPAEQAIFEYFGREFGLAYQIRDDLLDAIASEKTIGKDTGADAHNGRVTYASLLGEDGARELIADKVQQILARLQELPSLPDALVTLTMGLQVA